jgi:hypothetical protein
MDFLLQGASKKIAWRLIPYLMLCYFVAYLDRVNLGFAALTFKGDLGLSDTVYGLGASIFAKFAASGIEAANLRSGGKIPEWGLMKNGTAFALKAGSYADGHDHDRCCDRGKDGGWGRR